MDRLLRESAAEVKAALQIRATSDRRRTRERRPYSILVGGALAVVPVVGLVVRDRSSRTIIDAGASVDRVPAQTPLDRAQEGGSSAEPRLVVGSPGWVIGGVSYLQNGTLSDSTFTRTDRRSDEEGGPMVQIVFDSTAPICSPERTTLPLTSSMPMTVCRMTDELLGADLIIDDLPLTVLVGGTTEAEALDVLAGLREVTEAEWSALIEPEAEVVILD